MPIGGIGTGNLAICSDGSLRQWQLHNIGNHEGSLPFSFFAIRATRVEPPLDTVRILQAAPIPSPPHTPLVTDDVAPRWQHDLLTRHPGVQRVNFGGTYPIADLEFVDEALPLRIELEAFNPLVPLRRRRQFDPGRPVHVPHHQHRRASRSTAPLVSPRRTPSAGTASARSTALPGPATAATPTGSARADGWTSVVMENHSLAPDSPSAGQMVLAVDHPDAAVLAQWRDPDEFMAFLRSRALANGTFRLRLDQAIPDPQRHAPQAAVGPSLPGTTWNTGIGDPLRSPARSRRRGPGPARLALRQPLRQLRAVRSAAPGMGELPVLAREPLRDNISATPWRWPTTSGCGGTSCGTTPRAGRPCSPSPPWTTSPSPTSPPNSRPCAAPRASAPPTGGSSDSRASSGRRP